jgi:periplasmic glucans biosynthesis protein
MSLYPLSRRHLLAGTACLSTIMPSTHLLAQTLAQTGAEAAKAKKVFSYDDVKRKASELAHIPYNANIPPLPAELEALDWDAWREIRFRGEKDLLEDPEGRFKLQIFHLGHLFKRPVALNFIRDHVAVPLTYAADFFDYGRTKFSKPLPANLGYAGFRLHYPLNGVNSFDELISFIGSTYYRFLGRDQKYGLSARGLAIGSGNLDNNEEFPFFREFWIDAPDHKIEMITIYALLDSPSVTGAYKFDIYPQKETIISVTATLFARRAIDRLGMAPLTSMFFLGENDRHMNDRNRYDEFRAELHDSDGLLMHVSDEEWIWRPLKNPLVQQVQRFDVRNIKGFGLIQRDRQFDHYNDLELDYEKRPSYWIEPNHNWDEGVVELIELATKDETADNIVCAFVPSKPLEAGQSTAFSYRIRAMSAGLSLHNLGYVHDTFSAPAFALGSNEQQSALTRRFMVDFVGGDVGYYLKNPSQVRINASAQQAQVFRSFLVPHPKINGFRAMIDVRFEPDQIGIIQAFLQVDQKAITETWNYSWRVYNF